MMLLTIAAASFAAPSSAPLLLLPAAPFSWLHPQHWAWQQQQQGVHPSCCCQQQHHPPACPCWMQQPCKASHAVLLLTQLFMVGNSDFCSNAAELTASISQTAQQRNLTPAASHIHISAILLVLQI
jgi:hypothetical protein